MRVADLVASATQLPRHEALRLAQSALGVDISRLAGNPEMSTEAVASFHDLVARRVSGEPLQYIEGSVQFGPISVRSDRRALIPRPETERLWELAVDLVAHLRAPVIVDLCTGSGNLALALKTAIADASVTATDISSAALSLAEENAASLGLRVEFLQGDLYVPIDPGLRGKVDLIVSNPPYVASGEWESLPSEIREYEPQRALIAGVDGTEVLRRIASDALDWLRPGGHIVCEIGETQGEQCRELFAAYRPRIVQDLAHRDRYVVGCASQS